jgi:hypothetical protein
MGNQQADPRVIIGQGFKGHKKKGKKGSAESVNLFIDHFGRKVSLPLKRRGDLAD